MLYKILLYVTLCYSFNKEVILMILIGMLHHRKYPTSVTKAYAYAAVAKAEGAELLYFSPKTVNFKEGKINGYIYSNGSWKKTQSRFPDVIYNTGDPNKLERSREIIAKLKKDIPFTSNSIGNKMNIYKRLKTANEFTQYLIPSHHIHSSKEFFEYFNYYKKVVFKPAYGRKGKNIIFIERIRENFQLLIKTDCYTYTWDELKKYISSILDEESYLIQPYINCKTNSGLAYDFRLHVQKDGEGKWILTTVYPRMGPAGSIITNINNGGSTNYLEPFLKQEFGDEYYNIKRYLEVFSLQLATHMDDIQQSYFSEIIDELGIDVGLDDTGKIWIYEVNWLPGCPPAFYLELDTVKYMINYALFLAKTYKRENSKKKVIS